MPSPRRCASTWPGTRPAADGGYSICSAQPRLIGGKPTKNPRYLQVRPDMAHPRDRYVAEMGARLNRRLPLHAPVLFPVISVLSGRRNNRPGDGIRPLCVYGPIHYQELPELFMDYVCSLTGTSPSTTGAGSEGALTKGPFNALAATADLNNALVSMLLTGYARLQLRRRLHRPALPGGSRHQPADSRDLVPAVPPRARPEAADRGRAPGEARGLRVRREEGAGQPARLPHHGQVRAYVLRAGVRQPHRGVHRGDPQARDPGSGGLRRRSRQHRGGAAAGGGGVLRGRHDR